MATSRTTRSSGPVMSSISAGFRRSMSPSGRFHSGGSRRESSPSASSFASSSFSSPLPSPFFHQRSASPTRVNLVGSVNASGSVRFATSSRSIESPVVRKNPVAGGRQQPQQRRTCMCSPTTHPGSFRCALHKNSSFHHGNRSSAPSHRLNARRSAMTNSLVRIGTVEGDLVKRALAALIRPSSHQQRRRGSFQPRPSRLSVMSKAGDDYHLS